MGVHQLVCIMWLSITVLAWGQGEAGYPRLKILLRGSHVVRLEQGMFAFINLTGLVSGTTIHNIPSAAHCRMVFLETASLPAEPQA